MKELSNIYNNRAVIGKSLAFLLLYLLLVTVPGYSNPGKPGNLISFSYGYKTRAGLPNTINDFDDNCYSFSFADVADGIFNFNLKRRLFYGFYLEAGLSAYYSDLILRYTDDDRYCFTDEGGIRTRVLSLGIARLFSGGNYNLFLSGGVIRLNSRWRAQVHRCRDLKYDLVIVLNRKRHDYGGFLSLRLDIPVAGGFYLLNELSFYLYEESFYRDNYDLFGRGYLSRDIRPRFLSFRSGLSYAH